MRQCFQFSVKEEVDPEIAWEELTHAGVDLLYSSSSEDGLTEIFGHLPAGKTPNKLLKEIKSVESITEAELPAIDWEAQWAAHGNEFQNGHVNINLIDFGFPNAKETVKLLPGAGFGDVSHPTTRLMLRLMAKHMNGQKVIDVGCGSGVLSVCAIVMGANSVQGIDIDPLAIEHTWQNTLLNNMQDQISCTLPENFKLFNAKDEVMVLMNMISSEQQVAWESLPQLHSANRECITSGILKADKEAYLKQCIAWGWALKEEMEEGDWCAFYFTGIQHLDQTK
jgi:ribosomal protein L11 methyltransferase